MFLFGKTPRSPFSTDTTQVSSRLVGGAKVGCHIPNTCWEAIWTPKNIHPRKITRWWFQTSFMFIPTWGNDRIWLILAQVITPLWNLNIVFIAVCLKCLWWPRPRSLVSLRSLPLAVPRLVVIGVVMKRRICFACMALVLCAPPALHIWFWRWYLRLRRHAQPSSCGVRRFQKSPMITDGALFCSYSTFVILNLLKFPRAKPPNAACVPPDLTIKHSLVFFQ